MDFEDIATLGCAILLSMAVIAAVLLSIAALIWIVTHW